MQYLLTPQEYNDLVPKEQLEREKAKVEFLVKTIQEKTNICCNKTGSGYCDDCPIGSINNNLDGYVKFCKQQNYSQ